MHFHRNFQCNHSLHEQQWICATFHRIFYRIWQNMHENTLKRKLKNWFVCVLGHNMKKMNKIWLNIVSTTGSFFTKHLKSRTPDLQSVTMSIINIEESDLRSVLLATALGIAVWNGSNREIILILRKLHWVLKSAGLWHHQIWMWFEKDWWCYRNKLSAYRVFANTVRLVAPNWTLIMS